MKKTLFLLLWAASSLTASAQTDTLTSKHPEYLPSIGIGEMAPDFTATDTIGNKTSLSDYRGRYVILDFWATWCGDCRREIPHLKKLYSDVKDVIVDGQRMQWLSLSFDTKAEQWKSMLRKEKFPWPQISSLKSTREDPTFKNYKLNWIPAFFIVDPQGKIVSSAITADGLRTAINDLINKKRTYVFNLWPDGAPTSNGLEGDEIDYSDHVSNVTRPTLTVYMPEKPNGLAVMACPGGAYIDVWATTEGHNLAEWYNSQGIVYAVLKYRLPNGHKEVPLDDVHRAMKILKSHQQEYGFKKLGIQGCSAGGHLAAMASTHYASPEERPDFQILFYPVISLDPSFTHMETHNQLLGKNPSKALEDEFSNEKKVTRQTPPAIILSSSDDGLVPVRNSLEYYNALIAQGVPAAMHLYPVGGHGWCNHNWAYKDQWRQELEKWLKEISRTL